MGESFKTNYLQTIGSDFSYKSVEIENVTVGLAIWDLAGQAQFKSVHSLFYKGATAIIVVYDITNRASFDNVINWIKDFKEHVATPRLPLLLIGNKIDLEPTIPDCVTVEQQESKIKEIQSIFDFRISSLRTSAKTGENVNDGISLFTKTIKEWVDNDFSNKLNTRFEISTNAEENFPYLYLIVMHQSKGPSIIRMIGDDMISSSKHQSIGAKLITTIDFQDVISSITITGKFESSDIDMPIYYNAFIIENSAARGKVELYVIAFAIKKSLVDPIYKLKGIVDGYLHHGMNEFQKIKLTRVIENLSDINIDELSDDLKHDFDQILITLRTKLNKSLLSWFNISP